MKPKLFQLLAGLSGIVIALALTAQFTLAMSVVSPTFTDLVDTADEIMAGTVADVHSAWVVNDKGHRVIKTFVRLRVSETAKGTPTAERVLSFFGGTIDGQTMEIGGMPTFRKGQRGWFFIKDNGKVICPLIFAHHGAYLVTAPSATGERSITRLNGQPLRSLAEIGAPESATSAPTLTGTAPGMSASDFGAAVSREFERLQNVKARQP